MSRSVSPRGVGQASDGRDQISVVRFVVVVDSMLSNQLLDSSSLLS